MPIAETTPSPHQSRSLWSVMVSPLLEEADDNPGEWVFSDDSRASGERATTSLRSAVQRTVALRDYEFRVRQGILYMRRVVKS